MIPMITGQASLEGVAQNKEAVKRIVTHETLYDMSLMFVKATGAYLTEEEILAEVDYVHVELSDKAQGDVELIDGIPASVLLDTYKYHQEAKSGYALAGGIYYPFTREGLEVAPATLAIGMKDAGSITVKVKFKDVAILTADVRTEFQTDGGLMALGPHIEMHSISENHSAASLQEIHSIPVEMTEKYGYLTWHITPGAGTLDNVSVRRKNGTQKLDFYTELDSNMNARLQHEARKTPQAGYTHVDFARWGGYLRVDRPACDTLTVKADWTGGAVPGAYKIYTECLVGLAYKNAA